MTVRFAFTGDRDAGPLGQKPSKGLTKRIIEKTETKRTCPRCKRDLPLRAFFHHSFENMRRALPTATPTKWCNRCRSRRRGADKARIKL